MFPLHDDNRTLDTPFVTYVIIALNVAAWVFLQGMGSDPALTRSVCELGAVPGELLGNARAGTQVPLGPNAACVIEGSPRWITVLTSMFMHGGWFHLIGNMWFLKVFGDNTEDSMGHIRFALFYLICGIAAVAAQMAANPGSVVPMVGASGAIGGVLGAYAVLYPHARVHMLIVLGFYISRAVVPAALMLGYWFLIQILGGLPRLGGDEGGIAFWAHVGGFLAGVALSYIFRNRERVARHRREIAAHWGQQSV